MNTIDFFKQHFDELQATEPRKGLGNFRQQAFNTFSKMGIPTVRHEEWKYTRVAGLFNKEYQLPTNETTSAIRAADMYPFRLTGYENANELVFVNGIFSKELSKILSKELVVLPLDEAAENEYKDIVRAHLGHSSQYQKDGINALNTAFVKGGLFIYVHKGQTTGHPIYIYNITDARTANILSQPRSLVYICEQATVQIAETYATLGTSDNFTNQVMEIIVEKDAHVEYYKIQNDKIFSSQVSTTHIRQIGKSYTHAVTISLDGGILRNNLNVVLEAAHSEALLYGLYFQHGESHIDNHTVVDNRAPGCLSNEMYKGILTDNATGVFNGKIFVNQVAQKTNAYQSNKNILLSDNATVNTKPQLEIFADDVKCSHGCTVGRLDEEGLFYLQSRGIPEKIAMSLLLHGFADDILERIKLEPVRAYVDKLISQRLEIDLT
jgi:Fe-S cluster assembly protein SufD